MTEENNKKLVDEFDRLKSEIEELEDYVESSTQRLEVLRQKYLTLRKVFEMLGIKYIKLEGDDQVAFI